MSGTYEVYYHLQSKPFWGRTYPIALILEHGGMAYEVKKNQEAPSGTGFAPPMAQLPTTGACIAQTPAICVQIGRDCGLSPEGAADEAKARQLALDAADLFTTKDAERQKKWLTHLESVLTASGSAYFIGSSLSYADFCLLFPLTYLGPSKLKDYPDLTKWFTMMKALPGVQSVDKHNAIMPGGGSLCRMLCCCTKAPSSEGTSQEAKPPAGGLCRVEGASYTVYYHTASQTFLGRSYAPLLLLEHAKAKYVCQTPDKAPPGWFAPPIVQSSSGACISQTPAIMHMLGIELGLAPEEPKEAAKAFQLALDAADLFSEATASKPKPPARIQKWYNYFEATLQSAGSGYFLKGGLSYVDFTMLMTLETSNGKVPLETPKLKEWLSMMLSQDGVVAVKNRGIPMLPS